MPTEAVRKIIRDVIVIGGGAAGENVAEYAIQHSDRTAILIEDELLGGECSYWACMPSKALLRPLEVQENAAVVKGVTAPELDVQQILRTRDRFASHHDDESQVQWAESVNIEILRGRGRLIGEKQVEVITHNGEKVLVEAKHAVVLATGTSAAVPDIPGLRESNPWTSRDVTNMKVLPRRVAILGGGVVGCEAATWLAGLGSEQVTLITRGAGLLSSAEPFANKYVSEGLESRGVQIYSESEISHVQRDGALDTGVGEIHGGPLTIMVGQQKLEVDELVVGVGRKPNSEGLGLDSVGVDLDKSGFVGVDQQLQVNGVAGGWLYAVGDINGLALLTHMGKYQARVCGEVIASKADGKPLCGLRTSDIASRDIVPQVVFTLPQVASVGLTEAEAIRQNIDCEVVEHNLAALAASSLQRPGYRGRAKLVIDTKNDVIIGVTFVGPEVAELVHAATIAIIGKVPIETLRHAVPSYPTISEVWLRLLEKSKVAKS